MLNHPRAMPTLVKAERTDANNQSNCTALELPITTNKGSFQAFKTFTHALWITLRVTTETPKPNSIPKRSKIIY